MLQTTSAPDAGGPMGDLADQVNADYEAELHIRLHQTEARLLRAIENASARISQDRFGLQARYFEGPAGSCAMCSALQGLQGARAKLTLASANRFSECRRACPCNTWPPRRIHSI
jgi:hypothetical protein